MYDKFLYLGDKIRLRQDFYKMRQNSNKVRQHIFVVSTIPEPRFTYQMAPTFPIFQITMVKKVIGGGIPPPYEIGLWVAKRMWGSKIFQLTQKGC